MGKWKYSINFFCGDENEDSNKWIKSRGVSFGDVIIYYFFWK